MAAPIPYSLDELKQVIERHWGYRTFRPLQERAMQAVLAGRDSLVVLPTGGGKSLCYQAPAVLRGGTTVVVSPLISLMKDQVDGLKACGVPAIQIDSSLTPAERAANELDLMQGAIRLLFISPERLALADFCSLLRRLEVRTFAIDEAHCISHWGHDFRPDYRQLRRIKELFPQAAIHGYTATATQQVRQDICDQVGLRQPEVLVGNFDRPNLTYRVLPRFELLNQVREVLDRHPGEAGIIYCLRRADVDDLAADLQKLGLKCLPYHAGMTSEQRRSVQEAFAEEKCDLIVATVAFGMGIDRSNIRFVIHAAMPKSIEHYQQETGRAGRDGLEAECVLLHSGQDVASWKYLIDKSSQENQADPQYKPVALQHLKDMDRFCRQGVCRHRALVQYFDQDYQPPSCSACDLCLGDREPVKDALVVAQKILSCVARVKERFGITHVISVLRGESTEKIHSLGHDQLSTYGLLREHAKAELRDWIHQLIGQKLLLQTGDEYPVLRLNEASWEVMRKQRTVRLLQTVQQPRQQKVRKSRAEEVSWEGVDRPLFERLRQLRHQLAVECGVPPYIIFEDMTLRELARLRPSSLEKMREVYGIGEKRSRDFGNRLLQTIREHCQAHELPQDVALAPPPRKARENPRPAAGGSRPQAFELFRQGCAVEDVSHQIQRTRSTVMDYLADFITRERPQNIDPWVPREIFQRVAEAARQVGTERLKPIYLALEEKIPYDLIRLVVAAIENGPE